MLPMITAVLTSYNEKSVASVRAQSVQTQVIVANYGDPPAHFQQTEANRWVSDNVVYWKTPKLSAVKAYYKNFALRSMFDYTSHFLFMEPGSVLEDGVLEVAMGVLAKPYVGAVYGDYRVDNVRVFNQSYDRNRLLALAMPDFGPIVLPKEVFSELTFDESYFYLEDFQLMRQLTQYKVIYHVPRLFAQTPKQLIEENLLRAERHKFVSQ